MTRNKEPGTICWLTLLGSIPVMLAVPRATMEDAGQASLAAADFADKIAAPGRRSGETAGKSRSQIPSY